tara:strand:- start:29369 stop:29827 length:459 start_codon:yes stop_codon:yes gene_type:complete
MNSCVVVIDAWKYCSQEDLNKFPWLLKENKLFGSFLDLQLSNIKQKYNYDVIHQCGGHRPEQVMEEIQTRDLVIEDLREIPTYDYYYFCGFHLGRCLNQSVRVLNKSNCGIVYNLSLIFPEDTYGHVIGKNFSNNYMYSYSKGFEKITMEEA